MYNDPYYRQLVKVMQDNGREASTTRQSSRYKDDLQTARVISANTIKQKPKRKYKVEMPADYSETKIDAIFDIVHALTVSNERRRDADRKHRIEYLEERISALKAAAGTITSEPVKLDSSSDIDS